METIWHIQPLFYSFVRANTMGPTQRTHKVALALGSSVRSSILLYSRQESNENVTVYRCPFYKVVGKNKPLTEDLGAAVCSAADYKARDVNHSFACSPAVACVTDPLPTPALVGFYFLTWSCDLKHLLIQDQGIVEYMNKSLCSCLHGYF